MLAGALVGVLLFAQLAVAAYACPGLGVAQAVEAEAAGTPMVDCEAMAGAFDPAAPNLCAEHCKFGQQSDHAAKLNVPAAVLAVLYLTVPPPLHTPPPQSMAASISALVAASPAHAIAHCVFRI